eukprot:scaffold17907_cov185-Amphora_coffeaeformis.AAC.3
MALGHGSAAIVVVASHGLSGAMFQGKCHDQHIRTGHEIPEGQYGPTWWVVPICRSSGGPMQMMVLLRGVVTSSLLLLPVDEIFVRIIIYSPFPLFFTHETETTFVRREGQDQTLLDTSAKEVPNTDDHSCTGKLCHGSTA